MHYVFNIWCLSTHDLPTFFKHQTWPLFLLLFKYASNTAPVLLYYIQVCTVPLAVLQDVKVERFYLS